MTQSPSDGGTEAVQKLSQTSRGEEGVSSC